MEQVKIGSFPAGKAYGAFIYSININVGVQGSPTTIDVELINETGEYAIEEADLEASSPVTIRINSSEDPEDFIKIKSCFLVSYAEDKQANSSTLKLKYVDGSSVLDKIQVLLLNKQASPANFNSPFGGADPTWYKAYINPFISNFTIPISCLNRCTNTDRPPWSQIVRVNPVTGAKVFVEDPRNPWGRYFYNPYFVAGTQTPIGISPVDPRDFVAGSKNFQLRMGQVFNAPRAGLSPTVNYGHDKCALTNVNPDNIHLGGAIVIGEEEFVSSLCQIPNVTYGFEDLRILLQNYLGINITNWSNKGRPDLRESFTGSLRDVLNSWGNLYGYNFVWNFDDDSIFATDLENVQGGNDILQIKNLIENLQQKTSEPSAVLRMNYSTSIEGTYRQDDISSFLRPARKKTIEDKYTRRVLFSPVTIKHIIPYKETLAEGATVQEIQKWNILTGGRSTEELMISSVLAKFNKNARTLYNYWLIASKTNGFDPVLMKQYGGLGRPLGLSLKSFINDELRGELLSYTMNISTLLANSAKYGSEAGAFIGTYSKELEDSWIKWEEGIANFIGKYYMHSNFIKDLELRNQNMQQCFDRTVETIPQTEVYINGTSQQLEFVDDRAKSMINDLPFKDLLRHPNGAHLPVLHPDTKVPLNEFRLYARNPNYGFNEEAVENLFFDDAEDLLKEFIPAYAEIDANEQVFLIDLLEDAFPTIYTDLKKIKDESKKPMLFFFPSVDKVREAVDIPLGLRGKAGWELVEKFGERAAYATKQQIASEMATNDEDIVQVWNTREYQPKSKEASSNECELFCDEDLSSFLCDCPEGDAFGYSPDKVGLTSLGARFFDLAIPHAKKWGRFTLPSEYPYSAFFRVTDKAQKTEQGIKQNYGFLNNAAGTMGYKVNSRDITSDMETLDTEQNAGTGKIGGNVEQGNEGSGQIKAQVLINKFDEATGNTGKLMEARDFHLLTDSSYTNNLNNKRLSFEIAGLDLDALKINEISIINPTYGLSNLGITYGEGGLIMNFDYETRPEHGGPNTDEMIQKVGPRLNFNSYLRTY